mgnify:FL=1
MREGIHPELKETTITCACGEVYKTKSTKDNIRVEVCSSCHPFYTGKQRKSAKGGRVERFNKKYGFSDDSSEDSE